MADKYQGWENRATWGLATILDNDRSLYDYWQDRATFCRNDCLTEQSAIDMLAEMLEQDHESQIEDAYIYSEGHTPDFMKQLLADAMEQIDWGEIAEHLLAD